MNKTTIYKCAGCDEKKINEPSFHDNENDLHFCFKCLKEAIRELISEFEAEEK